MRRPNNTHTHSRNWEHFILWALHVVVRVVGGLGGWFWGSHRNIGRRARAMRVLCPRCTRTVRKHPLRPTQMVENVCLVVVVEAGLGGPAKPDVMKGFANSLSLSFFFFLKLLRGAFEGHFRAQTPFFQMMPIVAELLITD